MLAIKNQVNSMKQDTALSEEKLRKCERKLKVTKERLETTLLDKATLEKKMEAIASQLLHVNRLHDGMSVKLAACQSEVDEFQSDRGTYAENHREVESEIGNVERQIKSAREKLNESNARYEEAERRLHTLTCDTEKAVDRRLACERKSLQLEQLVVQEMGKLKMYEENVSKLTINEDEVEDELKIFDGLHRDNEERIEKGKLNVSRLERLVEQAEDEIESLQLRSRATKIELQNAAHST